jgi:hypothetical protein
MIVVVDDDYLELYCEHSFAAVHGFLSWLIDTSERNMWSAVCWLRHTSFLLCIPLRACAGDHACAGFGNSSCGFSNEVISVAIVICPSSGSVYLRAGCRGQRLYGQSPWQQLVSLLCVFLIM